MSSERTMRLGQVARKLNIGRHTIIEFLGDKEFVVEDNPNSKISDEQFLLLSKEFAESAMDKEEALSLTIGNKHSDNIVIDSEQAEETRQRDDEEELFIKSITETKQSEREKEEKESVTPDGEKTEPELWDDKPTLQGIKVVGKIDLKPSEETAKAEEVEEKAEEKEKKEETEKEKESVEIVQEKVAKKTSKEAEDVTDKKEAEEVKEAVEEKNLPEKPEKAEKAEKAKKTVKEDVVEEAVETVENTTPDTGEDINVEVIEAKAETLKGLTVVGKIDLPKKATKKVKETKPVASSDEQKEKKKKRPRKRIPRGSDKAPQQTGQKPVGDRHRERKRPQKAQKEEPSDKEIQEQIKATLAKLSTSKTQGSGVSRSKYRREKRSAVAQAEQERIQKEQEDSKVLNVNEFIAAKDLASLMDVSVNDVISTCMNLGMFVSINQRLDAEAITVIADEFGYDVIFENSEEELIIIEEEDKDEDLTDRAPIVTIMGHVDHGKTSLLDYIRKAKVTEGEAGGITQHIGAYDVTTESDKRIAFLDTPGHEAFTAMRARGAEITDVVIIVVAADDNVMPQTKEAINHAQAADVPIVIAINKIDKPNANADKIREALSNINILVEEWGGKYQSQEISAKTGQGIEDLLEKVLLEAELLELKANSTKPANGTVIEAMLDKGRGYLTTIMIQAGTLKVGDVMLAGPHFGKVKAMFDHSGKKIVSAGPSTPIQMLGLDGAPQAGDKINVMNSEREAREVSIKRQQLLREQSMRTKKHITLDEIGRRLAIGSFKELNIIVKGDVDGSVEALSDSMMKLSTDEIQINIIQKGVGQISESDVLLASASDAIVLGFQVRPSANARRLAEGEEIEIRLYSVIYDAINEIKDAMEGMLAPGVEEVITGNVEIREVFKISKVGTVAGCMVTEGKIKRGVRIRLIRDGIVIYTGEISALKRFKEDVSEVKNGYECGISIKNYNDLKIGDNIESFEQLEVKRTL